MISKIIQILSVPYYKYFYLGIEMKNQFEFQIPDGIIEIEIVAEKLYYTIIGKETEMCTLLDNINNQSLDDPNIPVSKKGDMSHNLNTKNKSYIISKLLIPLTIVAENIGISKKINIEIGSGIEQVQCSLLCECKSYEEKEVYTLLCIENINNKYILKFPEIELKENIEPETTIIRDIKKIMINAPKSIIETLRLIDITGPEEDILVYCARTSNPIKNKKKFKK